jgi:hypothetical protein
LDLGGLHRRFILFYPIVQSRTSGPDTSTFFILLARLFFLFFLSVTFAIVLGVWLRPQDRGEWQLGAFFLVIPAVLATFIAFILGFTARILRNHVV